jgi:radical SAM protein with 4Fe4S-binding SPASM domain
LVNLIAFDAHPPLVFEIDRLPWSDDARQGMALFRQDVRTMMAERLDRSRMLFHVRVQDAGWDVNFSPEDIRLKFQVFTNLNDPVPWTGRPSDLFEFLQSRRENALALVQATPSGIDRLADAVDELFNQGITNVSVTIDHRQEWDTVDFSALQTQWERILASARPGLDAGKLSIAQCHRIATTGENDCQAGLQRIFIAPDGVLWPCRLFYHTRDTKAFAIGDLDQGLSEFDNAPFTLFDTDKMQGCNQCDWHNTCDNRCLWCNDLQNNTFHITPGSVCAYEKVVRNAMEKSWRTNHSPNEIRSRMDDFWPLICPIQL